MAKTKTVATRVEEEKAEAFREVCEDRGVSRAEALDGLMGVFVVRYDSEAPDDVESAFETIFGEDGVNDDE